jgi:ADP-ribosylation factor-like protein 2
MAFCRKRFDPAAVPQHPELTECQRLSGASLLVFANKTDVNGCMDEAEIQEVLFLRRCHAVELTECRGSN